MIDASGEALGSAVGLLGGPAAGFRSTGRSWVFLTADRDCGRYSPVGPSVTVANLRRIQLAAGCLHLATNRTASTAVNPCVATPAGNPCIAGPDRDGARLSRALAEY